jgi:hypothetical protein
MIGVVVLLRKLLSLNKALTDLSQHVVTTAEKSIHSLSTRCPRPIRQNWRRGMAVHHLKGRCAKGGVEGSIKAILCPREPIHPSARPVTGNTAQIHCDDLVHHLRLPVRLGVERRTHA